MQTPSTDAAGPTWVRLSILGLLSFASGLFFFGCFKLMNFHWMSMSVLLSLLLIGMPIGGLIVVRYLKADLRSLSLGLALQGGAMLMALALYPLFMDPASRLDSLLTGTMQVSGLTFLMIKFLQLGSVFVPYYIAFGINEFLAYRLALEVLDRRTEVAYAIFLGGTSLAYVVLEFGSPWTGVVPLMVGAAGAVGMASAALRRYLNNGGLWVAVVSGLLLVCAVMPGLEDRYITQLELEGGMQLRTIRERDNTEVIYRRWGRYCHFSVMSLGPFRIAGFYNGGLHWYHRVGRTLEELETETVETVPFAALPEKPKILIIGPGGGEQVRTALMHDPAKVVAVEIIPDVIDVLGGPLRQRVGGVYNDSRVEAVKMDGRQYLANTDERFDLIFLPVVDTSITMLRSFFNSAETLYTVEAFASMRDHLTDNGMLAIQRPANFDKFGVLLRQYFRALQDVGMNPYVWLDNPDAMKGVSAETAGIAGKTFGTDPIYFLFGRRNPQAGEISAKAQQHLKSRNFFRVDDFGTFAYQPKTDNFRLRSDQLFNIFGGTPLTRNLGLLLAVMAFAVIALIVVLRRMFQGQEVHLPFSVVVLLAVLIGMNFLMLQQFVIFSLYRVMAIPMDAVFFGTVGFMVVAGVSGMVLTPYENRFSMGVLIACVSAALLATAMVAPESAAGIFVVAPLIILTGALFPSVFRGSEKVLLVVFAGDAIGALVGGVIAFLWPIAFGFRSYGVLTVFVFVATALTVWWARRKYQLLLLPGE